MNGDIGRRVRPGITLAVALASASLYGLLLAVVKGDDAGWRFVVGNLSAPYVLPSFLLGRRTSRINWGAALGVAAAETTLVGFYVWEGLAFDLVTKHSVAHITVVAVLALMLGGAYGGLGALSRRTPPVAGLLLALPFFIEPLVQILPGRLGDLRGDPNALRDFPYIFVLEALLGCIIALVLVRRSSKQQFDVPLNA